MTAPRVLLTGATGFVGAQILRALKESGAYVRITSRKNDINTIADDICLSKDIFTEPISWWSKPLDNIDIVIHSAWFVEPGVYLSSNENWRCLEGSRHLLKAFLASNAQHFVGIGTCFEYDTEPGHLSIQTPLKPLTPYAEAKVALFNAVSEAITPSHKTFSWNRLFYLFGENENPQRLVPHLHQQLQKGVSVDLTSGEQVRDYMNVRDAGNMIAEAALERKEGPLNICSGKPVTIRELAESIADQYGRRDLLNFGTRADNPFDPPIIVGVL